MPDRIAFARHEQIEAIRANVPAKSSGFRILPMPTRKAIEAALAKIPTTNCTHCMEARRKLLKMLLDRLPPEK
jgi:hypothetical protein